MFFKFILALLILPQLGCDYFLNRQSPPAEEQIVFKGSTLGCLKQVPSQLGLYLRDALPETGLNENFHCLRETLKHFGKYTRGKAQADSYSTEEIRSFLNEAMPVHKQVSAEFMVEIMKLKAVLLGGSDRVMTKDEIELAYGLLFTMEQEFNALNGKMRILLFQMPREQVNPEDLKAAQKQIEQSVKVILEASKTDAKNYGFDDIRNLIEQLSFYLDDSRLLGQLLRWLPLAHQFKSLFMGDKTLAFSQKDWQQLLGWSVRAYGITLEFVYWIRQLDLNRPEEMNRLIDFGDSVFDLIEASPEFTEKSTLSLTALDKVLAEIVQSGLLKTPIQLSVLQESLRMAVMSFIEGPLAPRKAVFEIESLNRKHLATLRFEWNVWALSQRQINSVFLKNPKKILYPHFLASLTPEHGKELIGKRPALKLGEQAELYQSWVDWIQLMRAPHPILWNQRERMVLRKDHSTTELGFAGMTKVSLLRSFTRVILRGYGTGTTRNLWDLTLNPKNFTMLQEDFRRLGEGLHALDPRSPNAAERTFKEASFFTFSGNGDEILTATELFEELNILTAAGGMVATDLHNRAIGSNCGLHQLDVFGKQYLDTPCFRKMFKEQFLDVFQSAPGLMALQLSMWGHRNEAEFYNSLWELGGASIKNDRPTEYGDLRTYATILYYIEILRLVYDTNEDMHLSQQEITRAAPRFKRFIAEKSPLGNFMAERFFVCLVFEQRKPALDWDTLGCMGQILVGYNRVGPNELLKVLAVLKADFSSPAGFNPQMMLPGRTLQRPRE